LLQPIVLDFINSIIIISLFEKTVNPPLLRFDLQIRMMAQNAIIIAGV